MTARSRQVARHAVGAALGAFTDARFGLTTPERRRQALARRTRSAFEQLGPAWIKLGQIISVRPDLFSAEWVFEMESLRDSVPPVSVSAVRSVIEAEFGMSVDRLFADFEDEPVASASIAQVHRARLRQAYRPVIGSVLEPGTPVAVKVLRPGVEAAILADIEASERWVGLVGRWAESRGIDVAALLGEFASTLRSECDLRREARVADRFAFDFRDDERIVVPRVVWPRTTRSVLTTEFVTGWRLSELDDARRAGIDGRVLAVHGATAFLRQVLVHGRFHADLHPANLLVTPDERICYLDFGIVGTTTPAQRAAIAQVLVATVYGDAERALTYSAKLGLVVPPERRAAVLGEVSALIEATVSARPRDVRAFAIGFLDIMATAHVRIPPGYGLLVKALVTVEGVARALYPDVDIVDVAAPVVTGLVAAETLSPTRIAERMPTALRAAVQEFVR